MTRDEQPADTALLSCPFCGQEASMIITGLDERYGYARRYSIKCSGCAVQFSADDESNPKGGYALMGTGRPKVVAAWNRRADALAQVVDDRCAKCGHPRSNHHYRHLFVSAT